MAGALAEVTVSYLTSKKWTERRTGHAERLRHDEVATLAYRLYEARGRLDGNDLDDWRFAERALRRYYEWGHRSGLTPG